MTNGIDKIKKENLIEVKGYKKANKNILKKVGLGIAGILVALAALTAAKGFQVVNLDAQPEEQVEETQNTTIKWVNPWRPTGGQGGNNNGGNTDNNDPVDPLDIINSWITGKLPDDQTVKVDQVEDTSKNSTLTSAQKAYIQEYVDYYGVPWEDAQASYFAFGPLNVTPGNTQPEPSQDVQYGTRYVFDADDIAAINALSGDLGMSYTDAENYYVNEVAPTLGKPIATETYELSK